MNDFLKDIVKDSKNDYASIVDDGVEAVMYKGTSTLVLMLSMHY